MMAPCQSMVSTDVMCLYTNSVNDVENTARESVYVGVYNTNSKYYHSGLFYINAS